MSNHSRCFNFTDAKVRSLPAHNGQGGAKAIEYSDAASRHLKLEVGRSGNKSFWFRRAFRKRKYAELIGQVPATTVAVARARTLELDAMIDRGEDPAEERLRASAMPTFALFAETYLDHFAGQKRSIDDDRSKIELYMLKAFGPRRLDAITKGDIMRYLAGLRPTLKPATINRHRSLLSSIFRLAVSFDRIDRNPVQGVEILRESGKELVLLSSDEIGRLMAAFDAEPNRIAGVMMKVLLLTGARLGEAQRAKVADLDLDRRVWHLPETKAGRRQHIALSQEVVELLRSLPLGRPTAWVFPGTGASGHLVNLRKPLLRALKAAGIAQQMSPHSLRHLHASLAIDSGVSLALVSSLLRHSTTKVTERYIHHRAGGLHEAAQVVSNAVSAAVGRRAAVLRDGDPDPSATR